MHIKHIDIWHHFIREKVEHGVIEMKYIPTQRMIAYVLTKAHEFLWEENRFDLVRQQTK